MRYLKRFNEELWHHTYKQAGDKLTKLGHPKRGEELGKWATTMEKRERDAIAKERLDNGIKMGEYEIGFWNAKIQNDAPVFTGKFHLYLSIDVGALKERYKYWREGSDSLFIEMFMAVIPANEESQATLNDYIDPDSVLHNTFYVNQIDINLSNPIDDDSYNEQSPNDPSFYPSGAFGFSPVYESPYTAYFMNRQDAVKFKKLLVDIFQSKIIINPTNEHPGGDKEWLLDELCSERDRTLEEFESIITTIKKVSINKLYKD